MSDITISANIPGMTLEIKMPTANTAINIKDMAGDSVDLPELRRLPDGTGERIILAADGLKQWTPETPVLYSLETTGNAPERFGFCSLAACGNRTVLLNGHPCYLRGYIRGIVAHDHPDMTGSTRMEYHRKNILQAKKYGFNLVRFHSTIPDEEFVAAADELGLFIHMEIGFAYNYDSAGNKMDLALDNRAWLETIRKYRNNPSVAIFCIGNEMHNAGSKPEVHALYRSGKELAPGKLIMDNSGWGEFDRSSADIFSQHIAYFFPFKHHKEMFNQDACWHQNGSMYAHKMQDEKPTPFGKVAIRRHAEPLRPTLAHEAVHYIEIIDYQALNDKFDAFAAKVGPEYLAANGIEKPRYLTELPKLIARKNLTGKLPDYIKCSEKFKKIGIKTYLEQLRLSPLNGFEMLQFADCLKYENKNGVVDCFDDDKYIDSGWMKQFNADTVLLADFPDENFFSGAKIELPIYLSHFALPENVRGTLTVTLQSPGHSVELCRLEDITTVSGLQKLLDLTFDVAAPAGESVTFTLAASFQSPEVCAENSWEFVVHNVPKIHHRPVCRVRNRALADLVASGAAGAQLNPDTVMTDVLNQETLADLAAGRDVLLCYHRDNPENSFYLPGTLDRYKPCIWDRGSNLGGFFNCDAVRNALGGDRYFGKNMQVLQEGGYKLNLDKFTFQVDELASVADKPVRDRMKGLIEKRKDFIDGDTLRNFCTLCALRVGTGRLLITTFAVQEASNPAVHSFFAAVLNMLPEMTVKSEITPDKFTDFLHGATAGEPETEDVMNHFWEIDNKMVEDTLFWESAGIDLAKLD